MYNFTSGVDHATIAQTLAYDPVRFSGPMAEANGGLPPQSPYFNCLVISDEPRPFIETSQIAHCIRKNYFLENRGATSCSSMESNYNNYNEVASRLLLTDPIAMKYKEIIETAEISDNYWKVTRAGPSVSNSAGPSVSNSAGPSVSTSAGPSVSNSAVPSVSTSAGPTVSNSAGPSVSTSAGPSVSNSAVPSVSTSAGPTVSTSAGPSVSNSAGPSVSTSDGPSVSNAAVPSVSTSAGPSVSTSAGPSVSNSAGPSMSTSAGPSVSNSAVPSVSTSAGPTVSTSAGPSVSNSAGPSVSTSAGPSVSNSAVPSVSTSAGPSVSTSHQPKTCEHLEPDISVISDSDSQSLSAEPPVSNAQQSTKFADIRGYGDIFDDIRDYMITSIQSRQEGSTLFNNSSQFDDSSFFFDGLKYLAENFSDSQVTSLDLSANRIDYNLIFDIARRLKNSNITSLSLKDNDIGLECIHFVKRLLEQAPQLQSPDSSYPHKSLKILELCLLDSKLTFLNLSNNKLNDDGIVYLASLLKSTQITSIDLGNNFIDHEGIKALVPVLVNKKMKSISLSNNRFRYDGIACLAYCLKDTELTSLDLSCNYMSFKILNLLAHCLLESRISTINFSYNGLGCDGIKFLAPILLNGFINSIDFSNNDMTFSSLKILASYLDDSRVEFINFSNNKLGNHGIRYLASILGNTFINSIDLSNNGIDCLEEFAPCLIDSQIRILNLSNNKLGFDGIELLASVLKKTNITSLDLGNTDINCESLRVLAPCLVDTKICSLNLSNNKFGHDGMVCLASGLRNSQITSIDISNNNLACESLKVFASCLSDTNINTVNLSYNKFSHDSTVSLSSALKCSKITSIDLSCTFSNYESLEEFAHCLNNTMVMALNLSNNSIQCNSLKNLLRILLRSKLTSLDLSKNNICCNLFHLASVLKQTHLTNINLSGNPFERGNPNNIFQNFNINHNSLDLSRKNLCSISLYHLVCLLRQSNLNTLNLSYNDIDCEDMHLLSQSFLGTEIVSLDVSNCSINCKGIQYLAQVLNLTQMSELNLANNEISFEGLKHLVEGLKGSKITKLDVSGNPLQYENIAYLAENLDDTEIIELNVRGAEINRKAALQLCENIGRCKNSVTVAIDFLDDGFSERINMFGYPDCCIEINEPSMKRGVANLINKAYKNVGIMKIIFDNFYSPINVLDGAFDNMRITEIELIRTLLNKKFAPIFARSEIGEWNGHCSLESTTWESPLEDEFQKRMRMFHAYPLTCVPKRTVISLHLQTISTNHLLDLRLVLPHSNIKYLDLGNNKFPLQFDHDMNILVEGLRHSPVLSLNLCNSDIGTSIEILAAALHQTEIFYINLQGNRIGYSGFRDIMNIVEDTNLCWLSLGGNNIEKDLQEDVVLSPYYIVPRNSTPKEIEMRYLFRQLVSFNTSTNEFEFTLPPEDSFRSRMTHYPQLMKMMLMFPNSQYHIYDNIYMKYKRHNLHLLNEVVLFIRQMIQRFVSFFENELPGLERFFGYDNFVKLVEECEDLEFFDLVQTLLLHRVLYYVDENREILHPFIYKMLHKYSMPLFNEDLEPNKKQKIIDYYTKHPKLEGVEEAIEMLLSLEPSSKKSRLN